MDKEIKKEYLKLSPKELRASIESIKEKDLKDTVNVVYWLNDKLLIAEDNIYYLNKEIDSNYKELEEYKDLRRIKKELDRSN